MRTPTFLADENIPKVVAVSLSVSDAEICTLAQSEGRGILTSDKDFDDLVRHADLKVPGVVLLRLKGLNPSQVTAHLSTALSQPRPWLGHFSVITKKSLRMRALAASST